MATLLAQQFESGGELVCPVSNRLFPVDDPDFVWLVCRGTLDLFLVATRNGEPFGARRHVQRIKEGQGVFGVGSHLRDQALMASPSPETQLRCLRFADFCEMY